GEQLFHDRLGHLVRGRRRRQIDHVLDVRERSALEGIGNAAHASGVPTRFPERRQIRSSISPSCCRVFSTTAAGARDRKPSSASRARIFASSPRRRSTSRCSFSLSSEEIFFFGKSTTSPMPATTSRKP